MSRAIDALIAEKVMGWSDIDLEDLGDYGVPPSARVKDVHGKTESWYGSPFEKIPYYSTDIAAAWQVVEHMADVTYGGNVFPYAVYRHWHDAFSALFFADDTAERAARSICLAALTAHGIEVPQ